MKHLTGLIQETKDTITYLESVETALNHAAISDIEDIREELVETGFVKRRTRDKRHKRKKPEQYLASDGKTIIMVGRNNLQNDELTFKMAKKENFGSMLRIFLVATFLSRIISIQATKSKLTLLN